jgi:hypothetical protein
VDSSCYAVPKPDAVDRWAKQVSMFAGRTSRRCCSPPSRPVVLAGLGLGLGLGLGVGVGGLGLGNGRQVHHDDVGQLYLHLGFCARRAGRPTTIPVALLRWRLALSSTSRRLVSLRANLCHGLRCHGRCVEPLGAPPPPAACRALFLHVTLGTPSSSDTGFRLQFASPIGEVT